jgi:hypothetical protein
MNRRFALLAAACLFSALTPSSALAQVKPATSTTPAPAAPAKWVPPVKGEATLDFVEGATTRTKDEILTKFKVRNTSKGSIALLSVEKLWYAGAEIGTSGIYRYKKLLNPGEVLEFTISCPFKPGLDGRNITMFRHAGNADGKGTVKPTKVKKIE